MNRVAIVCNVCGQDTITYNPEEIKQLRPTDRIQSTSFRSSHWPAISHPRDGDRLICPFCNNNLMGHIGRIWKSLQPIEIGDWDI